MNDIDVVGIKRRKQPGRNAKLEENRKQYINARSLTNKIVDTSFAYFISNKIDVDKIVFRDTTINGTTDNCLEEDELKYSLFALINKDPISYKEAIETKDSVEWQKAIDEEFKSMKENNVWTIVDRPTITKNRERESKYHRF